MDGHVLIELIIFTTLFLVGIAFLTPLTRKTSFPYTVALLLIGFCAQFLTHGLNQMCIRDSLWPWEHSFEGIMWATIFNPDQRNTIYPRQKCNKHPLGKFRHNDYINPFLSKMPQQSWICHEWKGEKEECFNKAFPISNKIYSWAVFLLSLIHISIK